MRSDTRLHGSANEVAIPQLHRAAEGVPTTSIRRSIEAELNAVFQLKPLLLLRTNSQRQGQLVAVLFSNRRVAEVEIDPPEGSDVVQIPARGIDGALAHRIARG